jgi:hypothetical protein
VLLLLESLKLQRNLDNYAFLRSSRVHGLENLDDKQDFQVTRVSILAFFLIKLLLYNIYSVVLISGAKEYVK